MIDTKLSKRLYYKHQQLCYQLSIQKAIRVNLHIPR